MWGHLGQFGKHFLGAWNFVLLGLSTFEHFDTIWTTFRGPFGSISLPWESHLGLFDVHLPCLPGFPGHPFLAGGTLMLPRCPRDEIEL